MAELLVASLVSLVGALLIGWLLPAWSVSRLLPVLDGSTRKATNYRGVAVPVGLGVVWAVWAASVALAGGTVTMVAWSASRLAAGSDLGAPGWLAALTSSPLGTTLALMPTLLVLGTVAFGMFDDAYGEGSAKGFRGHMRELANGRLTTGGLKMLGIGALAIWAAGGAALRSTQFSTPVSSGVGQVVLGLAAWICGALTIALTANLVNLTDLRPGRALKTYGVLAVAGTIAAVWAAWRVLQAQASSGVSAMSAVARVPWLIVTAACLLVLLLGPAVALARADLRERAMLGDAGANAMGALAGYLLAANLPLTGLAIASLVLLALNIASERVSFSRVIERWRLLAWLDSLGRNGNGVEGDGGSAGDDVGRG